LSDSTHVIYYALTLDASGRTARQLTQSLRSLRLYDPDCLVHILHCGIPPRVILEEAERNNVTVHELPPFEEWLALRTRHWRGFLNYPALIRILCLSKLPAEGADQILYVDCDTFWFASPRGLFENYVDQAFYACADVGSRAFPHLAYDSKYLDEDKLADIAAAERLVSIPPLNAGVMLMRGSLSEELIRRENLYLSYASRLLGFDNPLPFPARNFRLLDQVALWLTLGSIPGISYGYFSLQHVPIANRYLFEPARERIIAHYFDLNETAFFRRHTRL
jgi:hypothetical protein